MIGESWQPGRKVGKVCTPEQQAGSKNALWKHVSVCKYNRPVPQSQRTPALYHYNQKEAPAHNPLKFRLICAVCRSWGTGGRDLKDDLFYPRSTPDVNGDHGDVLPDLFNGSSIALSYFTGQRWKPQRGTGGHREISGNCTSAESNSGSLLKSYHSSVD